MNIGDKLYLANDSGVDTYIIDGIDCGEVLIYAESFPEIRSKFFIEKFESGELVNLFDNYDKAVERHKVIVQQFEERKQKYYEKILDEALNSVSLEEVKTNGKLLKSKREDKDLYSEALLYSYKGEMYVVINHCAGHDDAYVKFYKV